MNTSSQSEPSLVDVEEIRTAVIRGVVATTELGAFFDSSFSRLAPVLAEQDVAIVGPAFALYHASPVAVADLEVGFPTAGTADADGDVLASGLPGGRVARLVHEGSFDNSGPRGGDWLSGSRPPA